MHGANIVSSIPCKNKFLVMTLKKYAKAAIKVFCSLLTLLDFLIALKVFSQGCSYRH